MDLNLARHVLLWCLVFNYGVLLAWAGMFVFAHDRMWRLHRRWFRISPEAFDLLNWAGLAVYKSGVLLFNVAPLVALYAVA
jgi:hypothetical protein